VLLEEVKLLHATAQDREMVEGAKLRTKPGVLLDREFWCSADKFGLEDQKLFPVDDSTAESNEVASRFHLTMPQASIDRVERVENGFMHESFHQQASTLERQIAHDWNKHTMRQLLFHGTEKVEEIVNSVVGHGFLPLLAGTVTGVIHGHGTYFARDARYSNDYARTLPSGQKKLLVVDVLLGRWAKGAPHMKMLPLLPGERYVRYNSLVDNVDKPSIFVVQHSNQAYPKFLITYH